MKTFTRILALICAVILLVPAFASCANTQSSEETTAAENAQTQAPVEEVTVDNSKDKDGYLRDDLPDEIDYKGETVSILGWEDVERPEFEILEDETGIDMVKDAIYNRNLAVEDRLGVTLEWTMQKGNNKNRAAFASYVQNCYSGGTFYDIIATYSRTAAMLCVDGLLQDINAIEDSYLNFNQPWWPECMVETCSIDDSLFFISGDISTNILHFMYAIYYNMDLLKTLNLEDPIELVDNKTWTLDKLIEMTSGLYVDLDQDGKASEGDQYGFSSSYFHLDAFYSGSGLRLVEDDPNGILKISDDFYSEKAIALADKLGAWFNQGDSYVSARGDSWDEDIPFCEGRSVFIQNRVYLADAQYSGGKGPLREVDWEFGILPTPLYDQDQQEYITLLGNPITLWCVMANAKDPQMSSAVLECMASEAYRKTSPALFENNMKYRYTPDNAGKGDGARMFDIIRTNINFDLGRIFSDSLSYMSEMPSDAAANRTSWATIMKQQKVALTRAMSTLNKSLEAIVG